MSDLQVAVDGLGKAAARDRELKARIEELEERVDRLYYFLEEKFNE